MGKAIRLDKFLADSGVGTRTEVKKMIQKGLVQVNKEKAKKPELKVDPETDVIEFAGEQLGARSEFVYYLLHKPAGYVSATEDTREKTVLELVPKDGRRNLFPVGRLDKDTEGLLLITDDGQLAHQLLSPKKHVDKTYFAITQGKVVPEDIEKIKAGVDIGDEDVTLPGKLEILRTWRTSEEQVENVREAETVRQAENVREAENVRQAESVQEAENVRQAESVQETENVRQAESVQETENVRQAENVCQSENAQKTQAEMQDDGWKSEILLTIHEGRFHQVKRMMEALGKKVIYLKRISMGSLTLPDDLLKGQVRELSKGEVERLKKNESVCEK